MTFTAPDLQTPMELLQYGNTVTDGLFWPLMLGAIFMIAFISLMFRAKTSHAIAASGFLTGIIAVLLFTLGLVEGTILALSVAVAVGGFVMLLFSEDY